MFPIIGSWFIVHGSWFMVHAYDSWFMGSVACDSWFIFHGSMVDGSSSRFMLHAAWGPARKKRKEGATKRKKRKNGDMHTHAGTWKQGFHPLPKKKKVVP